MSMQSIKEQLFLNKFLRFAFNFNKYRNLGSQICINIVIVKIRVSKWIMNFEHQT